MAIQGTFLADFTQFEGATRSATKTLQDFEGTSKKVETSLNDMSTAAPTGLKKVSEGAQAADTSMLSLLRTARSVAGVLGIGFTVGAIVQFGRDIVQAADELVTLSDRTGIAIEGLQRLKVAASDSGTSIDAIARASAMLQDRLASGDKSAVAAVRDLGLSFESLRDMDPEAQLIAISDAIQRVGDSGEQIRLVRDLFERLGVEILPLLKKGFDDVGEGIFTMSTAATRQIDETSDAAGRLLISLKNLVGEGIGRLLQSRQELQDTLRAPFEDGEEALKSLIATAEAGAPKIAGVAPPGLPEDLAEIERKLRADEAALKANAEWAEKTAVAYQKLMSSVANEEGLAQMKEVEETMKRQAQNQEGLWLMERDAWQLQMAERAKQVEQEKAFADDLQKQNEAGLTIIGEMSDAVTVFGDATIASTEAAAAGFQGVASAANQAGQAIQDAIQPTIDWAQAYKDAGLFVQSSPFLGTSLLSQQNRSLSSLQGLTVNSNVNVSGVWDTNAQESIRAAVSDSVTRAVLQGRKVAA